MATNFVLVLEGKTGLKVEVKSLFFSPFGKIYGKGLVLRGKAFQEELFVRVGEFQLEPRENILRELWEKQDRFKFEELHYDLSLQRGGGSLTANENARQKSPKKQMRRLRFRELKMELGEIEKQLVFRGVRVSDGKRQWDVRQGSIVMSPQDGSVSFEDISLNHNDDSVGGPIKLDAERLELELNAPEKWDAWLAETPRSSEMMNVLSDLRIQGMHGELDDGRVFAVDVLRWVQISPDVWKIDVGGKLGRQDLALDARLTKKTIYDDDLPKTLPSASTKSEQKGAGKMGRKKSLTWSLKGQHSTSLSWLPSISYDLIWREGGGQSLQVVLYDASQNKIDMQLSREDELWVSTWNADLLKVPLPNLDWPMMKGKFKGGVSFSPSDNLLRFVVDGDDIQGGPGRTSSGQLSLRGRYDVISKLLTLRSLSVSEAKRWTGQGNLSLKLFPPSLQNLDVSVSDFPLGQYSPVVDGDLSIDAKLNDGSLNIEVNSNALYPNKDPLQKMESFHVRGMIDDSSVRFKQSFRQNDHENTIEVFAMVDYMLSDPLSVRPGVLKTVRSSSQIFELYLKEDVPVSVNIMGVHIPDFVIEDQKQRLNHLTGQAYIPFLKPSQLLIEAKGWLDLEKMPPVGQNKVRGMVRISEAKWNKGWSLNNLLAKWEAEQLSIEPEGVLERIEMSNASGMLKNRVISVSDFSASCGTSGKMTGKGEYHMGKRSCHFIFQGEGLDFSSPDFRLKYSSPHFVVQGKTRSLMLSGNVVVDAFEYHRDFAMLSGKGVKERLQTLPPETQGSRHSLDINVISSEGLKVKNNMAHLKFGIDHLKVTGALTDLRWFGRASTVDSETNSIRLPYQWLDISLNAKHLSMTFNGESSWDPRVSLQSETIVDGVQVFLRYDDHLSQVGQGKFKLSSSPSYTRREILSLLGSGEEPRQEVFENNQIDQQTEEAGPAITLLRSRQDGPQKALSYRAGVSSGDEIFELKVDYRLSSTLGIELSQTANSGSFFGLRFSKQVDSFGEMFRRSDLKYESEKKDNIVPIHWSFKGLTFLEHPVLYGQISSELEKLETIIQSGDEEEAKEQMVETISTILMESGYQNASFEIQGLKHKSKSVERRGGQRDRTFEKLLVQLNFKIGPRISLRECRVKGWPFAIPMPEHPWLGSFRGRLPLFKLQDLKVLKDRMLSLASDHGYPNAKVIEVKVFPQKMLEVHEVTSVTDKIVHIQEEKNLKHHKKVKLSPHILELKMDMGKKHKIVQIRFEGIHALSEQRALELISYDDGRWYNETQLDSYVNVLRDWYKREGYFDSRVQIDQVLSSRRYPRVSIKIKVTEGDRWRIGKISLEGLKRTSVSDLRKELTLREGDQAYPLVLEKNIARLSSLSHIVSVEALWGKEENGARNLVLKLEEISPWRLSTRVGFESEDGAQLAFRLRRENLNGLGHVASIDSDFSSKERHVVLRYSVPKLYKSLYQKVREQDWIGSYLIGEQVNLISSNDIKNKAFVTGFSFGRESELSSEVFDVTYREDRNIDGSFPTLRGKVLHRKSSLPLPMQPGKGWGWHFNGQMVAYLDRNRYAYIGDYRTSYGFKLGGSVMTPWLRLGHKWSLGPSFNLPISDRFFLGGTGSLRGFDDDSLTSGNKKGGESLAAFGTELFYPIEDWIDGSVFYEWGRVFDQPAFMGAGDPGHSLGMGLLIRTPVGPIQGYFAHPIGEDRIGHLGIQLGTIF